MLESLTYRQNVAVLRHLCNGSIGFDVFRDPRTAKKADLMTYTRSIYSDARIAAAVEAALSTVESGPRPSLPSGADGTPAADAVNTDAGTQPQGNGEEIEADAQQGSGEGGDGDGDGDGAEQQQQGEGQQQPKPQQDDNGAEQQQQQQDDEDTATAAARALLAALRDRNNATGGTVDENAVREIVRDELKGRARPIVIRNNGNAVQINERTHPAFEKVCRLIAQGVNVMLVGPAGCGKTHLAHQVATALGRPFGSVSYSAGASESWLLGRLLPTGEGGRFEYQPSRFCELYSQPSVFLHDEIDGADPNMLLTMNSALANGGFDNPVSGGRLARHAEAAQIASANTFGTGAGAMYVGRAQLDAATLDRWYIIEMDYDREFERELAPPEVTEFVWKLRERVQATKLRRVVSTRAIQKAAAALAAGLSLKEIKADLTRGWTADELAKVAA